jgi:hypothetical protein
LDTMSTRPVDGSSATEPPVIAMLLAIGDESG